MTTDWTVIFNGQMPPCTVTSGGGGANFAICTVANTLESASASAVGSAMTAPAMAPGINCTAGRQIQALHNFGSGSARVIASASPTSFRAQVGTGTGNARARANFTTTVAGGNVNATARIRFNQPTLLTVPQSVDTTDVGVSFFLYETLMRGNASLALNVGGGARFDAGASVTAVGFLN